LQETFRSHLAGTDASSSLGALHRNDFRPMIRKDLRMTSVDPMSQALSQIIQTIRWTFVCSVLAVLLSATASAGTYYVATDGDNNNDGSCRCSGETSGYNCSGEMSAQAAS
jgi:hypothetical protein